MGIKNKWKRNVVLTIAILAILMSILSPALTTFADMAEAQQKFDKESGEFLEEAEEAKDIINILEKDAIDNPKPKRDSINFVMKRLLYPGIYVNDVRDGVVSTSIGKKKKDILYDDKYACHPDSPNNLIDHNCNIPNFTTGLIQNIADPFLSSFSNADKSSSYSVFGLGVPANIPGGTVPINPENRTHTYTALELFGYNLQLTSYNGEWDQVVASNSARMLSNFGVIDKITLVGTGLWNSTKAGVGSLIENFSFNPVRWFGSVAKAYESAVSSGVNTVLDTSELNIVATNAWKRPRLDGSLYNVYVMSDVEVIRETARNYFEIFSDELNLKAGESAELQEVLSMNPTNAFSEVTGFSFDPTWETDKSKAARTKAQDIRNGEINHNNSERFLEESMWEHFGTVYTPDIISPLTEVPEPIYYTESEQMGFWEEDPAVAAIIGRASANSLISGNASSYSTYQEMMEDWAQAYDPYFQQKFDAIGETVSDILDDNDADVFMKHPHLDPKQGISRYACSNADGSIKRTESGTVEYLYTANNEGPKEFLNPNCSPSRPPIGGGLLGTGELNNVITDTRHISNITDDGFGIYHKFSNMGVSTIRGLNSFIAKMTNVVLDLSFSPILEKLGIDVIVAKLVMGFRDTVFFPLASLIAAAGALLLFFQILKNGNAFQLLGSLAITIIIFIAGAAFLLHPSATIKLVDEVPTYIDKVISDAVLVDNGDSSYCSTGDESDGIRSAQCNVWGAMVFEPWVHLQFGTGSDNLYAKGYGSGKGEMVNKNEDLVGNARVNMGGGKIENNWALYQLSKTKAGTINATDHKRLLGMIDKDLYRLVDLQAGPNNAANSDSRYFDTWSGKSDGGLLVILTLVQAILMSIAIAGLGIAKIEVSFMFSISIIFLPIMLLYSLLPKGRQKLIGYLSNLVSLMLKRIIIVVMLAVLLKVITLAYGSANSIETGSLIAIFVSVAFIMYRKELLELMVSSENGKGLIGGDTKQVREAIADTIPTYAKQKYNVAKANVKGASAGFVGAAMGAQRHNRSIRAERSQIQKELRKLDRLGADEPLSEKDLQRREELVRESEGIDVALANKKSLSSEEFEELEKESDRLHKETIKNELEIDKLMNEDEEKNRKKIMALSERNEDIKARQTEISTQAAGGVRGSSSIMAEARKGSTHSRGVISRTAERRIRAEGFAPVTAYSEVKKAVLAEGAQEIVNIEKEMEYDVYKEVLSQTETSESKTATNKLRDVHQGELARNPKLQRKIRKLAQERRDYNADKEYNHDALTPDIEELKKAASIIDKRRGLDKIVASVTTPVQAYKEHQEDLRVRNLNKSKTSKTKDILKEMDDFIESGGAGVIDSKGNTTIQDVTRNDQIKKKGIITSYQKELAEISKERSKFDEDKKADFDRRRKELDELTKIIESVEEDE